MPLQYRDIYDQWQRSQAFGDPRDISQFSQDLNENTGTQDYNAGVDPSWWKKASTAADVNFFEPIAKYSGLEATGRGIGGLFGDQGAETGARIARGLPRTIAQTLPLVAGEFATGGLATPAIVGGALATGGLFGAQTYAETGSPTAAAISGATAAALPAVGRIGGSLGARILGPETERVATEAGMQTLPKAEGFVPRTQFKAARFAGSQAAQIGTLEGSQALQAKKAGVPFQPLSPDFWAQQIPYSLLDLAQTARANVPTAGEAKLPPILPTGKDYVPPKSEPAAEANLGETLDQFSNIAKDQNISPEEKAAAFSKLIGTVMNPEAPTAKPLDRVILQGWPKQMDNGSIKLYGTASKYFDLPEHGNVFVNNPESATQFQNPDGSMTYITDRKNVSPNVKYPVGPQDFPELREKGQQPLTQQPPATGEGIPTGVAPVQLEHLTEPSPFDSGEQAVMKEAGVEPTAVPTTLKNEPGGIADRSSNVNSDELIRMVREGEKPAALLGNNGLDTTKFEEPYSLKEAQGWVDKAKEQGLVSEVYKFTDKNGVERYDALAGDGQDSVDRLKQAIERDPNRAYEDKQAQIGRALGYSETDIQSHIARLKSSTQTIETANAALSDAQAKLESVPKTSDDVETLFHGTNQPVTKFIAGKPVYLTSDLEGAMAYAKRGGWLMENREQYGKPRVLKVSGIFDKVADDTVVEKAIKELGIKASVDEVLTSAELRTNEVFDLLTKQGYDAVKYSGEEGTTGKDIDITIALNPEKLQVSLTHAALKQSIANGATPTQAVEKVRLQQQTPIVDQSKQKISLAQDDLREAVKRAQAPETRAGLLKDKTTGKVFKFVTSDQADAMIGEFKKANPESQLDYRPALIRGKYVIRAKPRETSLEGAPGTSLENVPITEEQERAVTGKGQFIRTEEELEPTVGGVPESAAIFIPNAEDRPDVSFNDYLGQLSSAENSPSRFARVAGFEDNATAGIALKQFRAALEGPLTEEKTSLKDINSALKKAGLLQFDSNEEMHSTFKMVRAGLEDFSDKYRSFSLDSHVPYDQDLTNEIGVLQPQGMTKFLDWFIQNQPESLVKDLATGLRKFSDFAHVGVTNDEGKGSWFDPKTGDINLTRLPSDREDALGPWGANVLHELAHDTVKDLATRTDPAALSFKANLQLILKTLRTSKQIPDEVRGAINKAINEDWYSKGAEEYNNRYDKALPGRDQWKGVHYSLLNEYELLSGVFDSPELVRIMQNTKMQKTPSTVLNFFANAWAKMFGYTPNAENAFAKLISSYDNYLSGTRNARGYNGMSYIRDSLVASGVKPEGLSSRLDTIANLYATGDLAESIKGFEREQENGQLPATTVAGPLNNALKTVLSSGDAKAVGAATDNLLANELPQHRELWWRMKEDLQIAKNLSNEAKKGNIFAEQSLFQEGLKNQGPKLNAMKNALDKYDKALGRFVAMDALGNNDGIQRLWSSTLKGNPVPEPTDQSGNEDIARQALGLEAPSAEYISNRRRGLAETGAKPMSWIDKNFKFASFTAQENPGFKPIYDATHETQSDAYRRIMELQMVKNSGATKGWDKEIAKSNQRVYQTPGLDRIASDILRRAQVLDKMHETFSFNDPEVQEALKRASTAKRRNGTSDRDDIVTAINSEFARSQHYINSVVPEHLTRMNQILTSGAIIGREIGMPYTKAEDLSKQLYTALGQLRDPAQAPMGVEALRAIASQMQPDTFTKVLAQTNGFITDSERHLAVLQKYQHYVSEQRYGNFHLVMSREGEPLRESYNTEKAARTRAKELQSDGWTLEDIVPKNRTNIANTWGHDPVVSSMQELDQQALNRFESLIADLPLEKQQQLRPLVERAADYQASNAAFTPVPTQASPRRRFVAGRETLDMIDNAEQYYRRSVNWMRHRETRAQTAFQQLDPELLGNRPLREYSQQFVDNQLAPDNPVARRLAEATFYWNLAGNFGVDFLHSIQSMTTGMASVIRETGSVGDAMKYVTDASKKVFGRYTTGKFGDKNDEWYVNWQTARGGLGLPAWGDIFDPTTMNYFQTQGPESSYGKALNAIKNGVRGYKGIFLRHNDMVGGLAGFQLGLDRGMSLEDAARFGEGVKDRGFYSAGKVQRSVGLWSIKEKAVPQMLSALKTYTQGWFSQLGHYYKSGFANAPGDYTAVQRQGAKQAFLYMLGAQAVLAGGLGLPGVGQGLALLKQSTGLDLKGWARKNLASMFGEDQDDYGGLMTGLAMHGLVSQFAPFDPSGRHVPNFPFIGVTPSKGFDISQLAPAPFTTAADILTGLMSAAKGGDPTKALPPAFRGPVQLLQGEGDIRNSKGELLYQLSPAERVVTALGLTPSRVSAAKETAATVKDLNAAATQQKDGEINQVATLYRRGDTVGAQKRLAEIQQKNPTYDMASFVKAVAASVEKQTMPFDWKREVNPALDIAGLANDQPSRELERLQLRRGVASGLGLYERPNLHSDIRAASIDNLMNSDPYTTRQSALQRLLTARQLRNRSIALEPQEYQ